MNYPSYYRRPFRHSFSYHFACSVILFVSGSVFAQTNPRPYPVDIVPASPNAASIQQYGDVPVTLFNGLPNISVPLMTVKDRELSLPVSLSYHASGINPDRHPGWVGLGWSLQAGGVITREIVGGRTKWKCETMVQTMLTTITTS